MSWDIILLRTRNNYEDIADIAPELIAPWSKALVLQALRSMGRADPPHGNYQNIWLGERTCIECSLTENAAGEVLSIHMSIGGESAEIERRLAAVRHTLGGRYYDVSAQQFLE